MNAGEMLSSIGVLALSVVIIVVTLVVIALAISFGIYLIRAAWRLGGTDSPRRNKNLEDQHG